MADRFFDTSAAAKHYRVETGTAEVDAFLTEAGARHFISALSIVELHSALARLARMGQITAADFHLAGGRFLADIGAGLWQVVPIADAQLQQARRLIVYHGLARSLRTLDALQLATALALNAATPLDAFVCADAGLGPVAVTEGLTFVNPGVP
jgi:predicted nucleic acid-binding protein